MDREETTYDEVVRRIRAGTFYDDYDWASGPALRALERNRYLSHSFDFAAPGDQQRDVWMLRFDDQDRRDIIYTGPDAEERAWQDWNQYAPSYNLRIFRTARLKEQEVSSDKRYPSVFYSPDEERRIGVAHYTDHNGPQPFIVVKTLLENKPGGLWIEVELSPEEAEQMALHLTDKVRSCREAIRAKEIDRESDYCDGCGEYTRCECGPDA